MVKGREKENRILKDILERSGNHVLVLYGLKGIGKTTVVNEFIRDNQLQERSLVLTCHELTVREELYQWNKNGFIPQSDEDYPDFPSLLKTVDSKLSGNGKILLVFDEFHYLLKYSRDFTDSLFEFLAQTQNQYMVLLVSSSIAWVENSIVSKMGQGARGISGFLKVNGLGFGVFRDYFDKFRYDECVNGYAILGGIPGLWRYFDRSLSLKENIIKNIINPCSVLHTYGEEFVGAELRETYVYNAILSALAEGRSKLNELFLHTEFSRPKISVYIKNMMELGILSKEFSVDTEGRKNAQKGIYDIAINFVDFSYRFLYGKEALIEQLGEQDFYNSYIKSELKAYAGKYFPGVCREYLEQQNQLGQLPLKYEKMGNWIGKAGTIDFVCRDGEGHTLVGVCNWEKPILRYQDFEWLRFCLKQARLKGDYIYLFSAGGFDEELSFAAKKNSNIKLVSLDEL